MSARARPFAEARRYAHTLGLNSPAAWRAWARSTQRPADIPQHPQRVYRGCGWTGWADWLGTANLIRCGRAYRPFAEARAFARGLGLQSETQWRVWARTPARPADIPMRPAHVYRTSGWAGMGDWLGTGYVPTQQRRYRDFAEARAFVRSLELENWAAWARWSASEARPADIPSNPHLAYAQAG